MDQGRCGDDRSHGSHVWMAPHMHITECPGVSEFPNQVIEPAPAKQPAIHQLAEAHDKLGEALDLLLAEHRTRASSGPQEAYDRLVGVLNAAPGALRQIMMNVYPSQADVVVEMFEIWLREQASHV